MKREVIWQADGGIGEEHLTLSERNGVSVGDGFAIAKPAANRPHALHRRHPRRTPRPNPSPRSPIVRPNRPPNRFEYAAPRGPRTIRVGKCSPIFPRYSRGTTPSRGKARVAPLATAAKGRMNSDREWCPGAESNHRHCDFQSHALPTELPGQVAPKSKHLRRRQPEGLLIRGRLSRVQPKSPAAALHF